jgi:amino acid transporter
MIQRKQTIFLLLVIIASAISFFFPLAEFIGVKDSIILFVQKAHSLVPDSPFNQNGYFSLPLLSATGFVILFSLIAIFSYKNRKSQLQVIKVCILVEIIMIGLFFFYYVSSLEKLTGGTAEYKTAVFMPLISLVFLVLAYRGVLQDEKLIRSADRLR